MSRKEDRVCTLKWTRKVVHHKTTIVQKTSVTKKNTVLSKVYARPKQSYRRTFTELGTSKFKQPQNFYKKEDSSVQVSVITSLK